jgi:hypothetical protein
METQALVLGPTRELAQQIEKARVGRTRAAALSAALLLGFGVFPPERARCKARLRGRFERVGRRHRPQVARFARRDAGVARATCADARASLANTLSMRR